MRNIGTGTSVIFTFLLTVLTTQLANATITYEVPCGAIPDATSGGPGLLQCGLSVLDSGNIPIGDIITVSLLGLQHEASGDLTITLTHFTDITQTNVIGTLQYIFDNIGNPPNSPFGYSAQFGDPFLGTGDNYHFNSSYTGDLWATAAGLGSANGIPGEAQDPIGLGRYFPTSTGSAAANNLSSAFASQPFAGYWRLDVTDNFEGPSGNPGNLTGFRLTFEVASVPEPAYAITLGAALSGLWVARSIRSRRQ